MTLRELKSAIANKALPPLNVFYGEESYLLNHYISLARGTASGNDFDVKKLYGADCSYADIEEAVNAAPFMSDYVFTEVRDFDLFSMPENDANSFTEIAADMPAGCRVIFAYSDAGWKPDKRRKLWKTLEKYANVVEFKAQPESDLVPWVIRHFQAAGKRISNEDALYLIRRSGRLMSNLKNEIDKLSAYCSGTAVTTDDIRLLAIPQLEAGVFDMAESLISGDYESSAAALSILIANREETIPLVAALSWKFRHAYASAVKNPRNPRFEWLADAILLCADADVRLKSSSSDDTAILSDLYASLAATRRARLGR
jgi:DNA polymerase-3 subunit delta